MERCFNVRKLTTHDAIYEAVDKFDLEFIDTNGEEGIFWFNGPDNDEYLVRTYMNDPARESAKTNVIIRGRDGGEQTEFCKEFLDAVGEYIDSLNL